MEFGTVCFLDLVWLASLNFCLITFWGFVDWFVFSGFLGLVYILFSFQGQAHDAYFPFKFYFLVSIVIIMVPMTTNIFGEIIFGYYSKHKF